MSQAGLPSSHVFFTAAWGRRQRTVAVQGWAVAAGAALLAVAVLWSLGCSAYVVGHDALLGAAMRRQRDMQYDYEDRVAALQRQLERTRSQQAQLERTVGTRLDLLTAQEGELRRRAGSVTGMAEAVQRLAPATAGLARQAAVPAGTAPDAMSAPPAPTGGDARRAALPSERTADRLAALTRSLSSLDAEQQDAVARLQAAVADKAARYREALSEAGLSAARFATRAGEATGGPFVPLDAKTVTSPFERASLTLRASLDAAETLRAAIARIPFDKPLAGAPEVTSPFGARTDPFLGRPALHTGVDLREEMGSEVRATAPGRVVSAGPASGYGNMVEIDHGAGLATRYAHLSAVRVLAGDSVAAGDVVGLVGATGRATGPHLHYETRVDGEPVDPMRFLQAGERLAAAAPRF